MPNSVAIMIICVVGISVIGGGLFRWLERRDRAQGSSQLKLLEQRIDFLEQQQLPAMQERLNVLEKIVTEEGYELKRQIRNL